MRKRLAIAALALIMGGAGAALLASTATAQQSCPMPAYGKRCCVCDRYQGAWGIADCTDGCPQCSGNLCMIAVTGPAEPVWDAW
jgi:hypothetical protein